ncbi:hypothetical protein TRAPUB_6059 [Trametes pubescens]|uniref:Uncharacterized protein n=1 Tax=Trametes pubescens TaxID=154538 RepID=A0A1M2V6Y0_TRAPU|nr:hypothetical protein TRAPUB_6059 [Trametes pubescens]
MNAGVRVLDINRFTGPVAFSSSSSLLTASQRTGIVQTAAPLSSSGSRVVNTIPRTVQQPKAGPSNLNSWAQKPQSVGASAKKPGPGSNTTATQSRWKPASEPSRRLSGASKKDPIVIDISDSDDDVPPKPAPSKPLSTARPSPSIARATPVRRKNAPIPPGALGAIRQNAPQRALQAPPEPSPSPRAPPPSLSYRTAPSSSLPSSASGSGSRASTVASSPAAVPAPQSAAVEPPAAKPAGTKRRLGMGRTVVGYSNKKFKPLVPGSS